MTRHRILFVLIPAALAAALAVAARSDGNADTALPVRGFCIAAPLPDGVDALIEFIEQELVPASVNTLVLRVDYNFEYKSHPELRDEVALSERQVKKIVKACRRNGIRVIPQINLLGHQSWEEKVTGLLNETFSGIAGLKGVHCCGNTDWSVLLATGTDILSFDAYNFAASLAFYPNEVKGFLTRRGAVA